MPRGGNLKFTVFLFLIIFFSSRAHTVLLVEPIDDGSEDIVHADVVQAVACPDLNNCALEFIGESWPESLTLRLLKALKGHSVVNMSFGYQAPANSVSNHRTVKKEDEGDLTYEEKMKNHHDRRKGLERLFKNSSNTLYTVAAGNGYSINGLITDGMPLIRRNAVYPAFTNYENVLKVTSLDTSEVKINRLEGYKIDDYANYSVEMVDLAAPVETLDDDIKGTSFAAPYVARLAERAFEKGLSLVEVKELLFKSSHVQGLQKALRLTEEFLSDRKNSKLYKIEHERKKRKRDKMIAKLHPVLLVKSGGPLVEPVFNKCLKNYIDFKVTVEEACLKAHAEVLDADSNRLSDLQRFWALRGVTQKNRPL